MKEELKKFIEFIGESYNFEVKKPLMTCSTDLPIELEYDYTKFIGFCAKEFTSSEEVEEFASELHGDEDGVVVVDGYDVTFVEV